MSSLIVVQRGQLCFPEPRALGRDTTQDQGWGSADVIIIKNKLFAFFLDGRAIGCLF